MLLMKPFRVRVDQFTDWLWANMDGFHGFKLSDMKYDLVFDFRRQKSQNILLTSYLMSWAKNIDILVWNDQTQKRKLNKLRLK